MKTIFYALLTTVVFSACQGNKENAATYSPRVLTATEKFNYYPETRGDTLALITAEGDKKAAEDATEVFSVKYKDTVIQIQTNPADKASAIGKFSTAEYVNTQKTTLLVQIADNSGLEAPVYLISIADKKPEVISLYRASKGKNDKVYTKGIIKTGRDGYLVNNDFFVTNVNAKVFLIKRQNEDERIQGEFMLKSPDKQTLAFLCEKSFFQVHYPTGKVFDQALKTIPTAKGNELFAWIQENYKWDRDKEGISHLIPSDNDKIVDLKSFK
ncbi:hypothetical protein [Pedobacter steynii]